MPIQDSDNFIIGRGDDPFKYTYLDLKNKLTQDGIGGGGGVSEAPQDGKQYGRQNAAWTEVTGSGGGGGTAVDFPPASIPGACLTLQPTDFSSTTQKIEFSKDKTTWTDTLESEAGDVVHVQWKADAHTDTPAGSDTEETMVMEIINVTTYNQLYTYAVDKIPDSITYDSGVDVVPGIFVQAANTPVITGINTPIRVWGSSDSSETAQIYITEGQRNRSLRTTGQWVDLPATPGDTILIPNNATVAVRHKTDSGSVLTNTTQLKFGWDETSNMAASYTTTTADVIVTPPTILKPTVGSDVSNLGFEIEVTAMAGVNVGAHASTDWQIGKDIRFDEILEESLEDTSNLTTYTTTTEYPGTNNVYIRVRQRDSSGFYSAWSIIVEANSTDVYDWRLEYEMIGSPGGDYNNNVSGRGGYGRSIFEAIGYSSLPYAEFSSNQAGSDSPGNGAGYGGRGMGCRIANAEISYSNFMIVGGAGGCGKNQASGQGGNAVYRDGPPQSENGQAASNNGAGGGGGGYTRGLAGGENLAGGAGSGYHQKDVVVGPWENVSLSTNRPNPLNVQNSYRVEIYRRTAGSNDWVHWKTTAEVPGGEGNGWMGYNGPSFNTNNMPRV